MDISCVLAALLLMYPQEKPREGLSLCENAYSILFEKICSHRSTIILAVKSSVTREKSCQLKCEILILYDLLARIAGCFCFIWLVTVMRDDIDAVVCVCMVLTVPTYLHPLLSPTPG